MTRRKAEELLRKPIDGMSLEQIQAHKVKLVDAWRESRGERGYVGTHKRRRPQVYPVTQTHPRPGCQPGRMVL